jgi:hypothetical protein
MGPKGFRMFFGCLVLSLGILAVAAPAAAQRWQVENADWGAGNRVIDVTEVVRSLVNSGETRIQVGNYTMRGDPAHGEPKILRIRARAGNGEQREFTFREDEFLDLNMFREGRGYEEGRPPSRPPVWGNNRDFRRAGACFYRDKDFHGQSFCVERGSSYDSLPPGFNDRITSIRLFGGAEVAIYNDSNFRGVNAATRENVRDLRYWRLPTDPSRSWNDRVSSIQVR